FSQCKFMILNKFECFKGDASKGRDERWIEKVKHALQICRAILDLRPGRFAVGIGSRTRTAHYGGWKKNLFTPKIDRIEQCLKILAGFVAIKRAACSIRSGSSRRLADKQDLRLKGAVKLA